MKVVLVRDKENPNLIGVATSDMTSHDGRSYWGVMRINDLCEYASTYGPGYEGEFLNEDIYSDMEAWLKDRGLEVVDIDLATFGESDPV